MRTLTLLVLKLPRRYFQYLQLSPEIKVPLLMGVNVIIYWKSNASKESGNN